MINCYSQNGEDCILWALFENQQTPGFFVEVGVIDGTRFSNTFSFEEAGWSGICVEAHPDYIDLIRKNRSNSLTVHAAVADHDSEDVTFYANSRGSLSTLDPSLEDEFRSYGEFFTGWQIKKVPMRTLNSIFMQANAPHNMDILSIDVEGTEMAVLEGLDINTYRPRVMVIESRDEPTEMKMDAYLADLGYIKARKLSNNIFYCRDEADVHIIAEASITCSLIHTPHPCDIESIQETTIINNDENNKTNSDDSSKITKIINKPLLEEADYEQLRIFATTVIRGSLNHELTGYLLELDWQNNRVINQIPIPIDSHHPFWNARGGNRGGRGVFVYNNILYVATALSVLTYDSNLNLIGEINHPYLAGLHEIYVDSTGIWLTASIHDLVIKLDFNGNIINEWWGSESEILQKAFGFSSRTLNLNLDFPSDAFAEKYDQYSREERLHINSVWSHNDEVYVLSCSKGAIIKIHPLPEKIILVDDRLSSPHNGIISIDGRIIINDTRNQCIRTYDLKTGSPLSTIFTQLYEKIDSSEQFSTAGWQRGLKHIKNSVYIVGTSPASIFEVDIDSGIIGQICRIDDNTQHCIHGLTATFDFRSGQISENTNSDKSLTNDLLSLQSTSNSSEEKSSYNDPSTLIDDKAIIKSFTDNPENTFFVSFPRTGSHWLRMLMELYFERPSLVRVFYYPERTDYPTLHTHDLDLDVERSNVIYLYRDPVDTIFSQMKYYKEDINSSERIYYWSNLYGLHLNKWLNQESFTKKKTVIRYELLKSDLPNEFRKICDHFKLPFDETRLLEMAKQISKEHVKDKTPHDEQVITLSNSYDSERDMFRKEQSEFIWQTILDGRQDLRPYFESEIKKPERIKFSGFVVTCNEAHHLRRCLSRLSFCDQLVVIDLGSTDNSVEIAKKFNAEVIYHQRVPVVEQIWPELKPYANNDWLIIIDPDEELPAKIEDDLRESIKNTPNLGAIKIPLRNYFKNKPLYFTRWGQGHGKMCVFHKDRINFNPSVHRGKQLQKGFIGKDLLGENDDCYIRHSWADSYCQLFNKHWRYIKHEGQSRFDSGQSFSWHEAAKDTCNAIKENLMKFKGIEGGFRGIFLSFFYGWYIFMSWLSLRKYKQNL